MARRSPPSKEQLADAVAQSSSWRGVLRSLGIPSTSSSAIRSVRQQADRAGLDYSHFPRSRRVTDSRVREAVAGASDWTDVTVRLGLADSSESRVRAHAHRLGLDVTRLQAGGPPTGAGRPAPCPSLDNLRHAAPLMAAASLRMRGHHVSWPLEPARYDLLADFHGRLVSFQVKTTTHRQEGRWTVWLSSSSPTRTVYGSEEVDAF